MSKKLSEIQRHLTTNKPIIRNATLLEVKKVYNEWLESQKRHTGINDAQHFYLIDPNGFFVLQLNKQIIGHIFAVKCQRNFGFIGGFYVLPQYRQYKIGVELLKHASNSLQGRNYGYEAMKYMEKAYEKYLLAKGFCELNCYLLKGTKPKPASKNIVPLKQVDFQLIRQYQLSCVPGVSQAFTKAWTSQQGFCIGYMQGEKLRGYSVLRPAAEIMRIGPLYADSAEIAEELFEQMRSKVGPEKTIYYAAYGQNKYSDQLAVKNGAKLIYDCIRCYRQSQPKQYTPQKVFGILN